MALDTQANTHLRHKRNWQYLGQQPVPVLNETPAGTVNSSNVTFTLAHTPVTGSLMLFVNGTMKRLTTDYTVSDNTITFVSAPSTGQWLKATYSRR